MPHASVLRLAELLGCHRKHTCRRNFQGSVLDSKFEDFWYIHSLFSGKEMETGLGMPCLYQKCRQSFPTRSQDSPPPGCLPEQSRADGSISRPPKRNKRNTGRHTHAPLNPLSLSLSYITYIYIYIYVDRQIEILI